MSDKSLKPLRRKLCYDLRQDSGRHIDRDVHDIAMIGMWVPGDNIIRNPITDRIRFKTMGLRITWDSPTVFIA